MQQALGIFFAFAAVMGLGFLASRVLRGKPLLSQFHMFLLGVIVFQVGSAAHALLLGRFGDVPLTDPATTGLIYGALLTLFITIVMVVYFQGWCTFGLQYRIGTSLGAPNDTTMIVLSVGLFALAVFCRFVIFRLPIVSPLGLLLTAALASASAAMVCWAWSRNWLNPAYIIAAALIVGAGALLTIYQNFSRRDLICVMIGAAWGAYHGHFKYLPLRRMVVPLGVVGACGIMVVSLFTGARNIRIAELNMLQVVQRMAQADTGTAFADVFSGQDAAAYSMWLTEVRFEQGNFDTLHSLRMAGLTIIPRVIFPNKPEALGITMVAEAGITGKDRSIYSVGPGLMGHIMNDNPFIALPLYAILIAVWLRIVDELCDRFPGNPFILVPAGVAFGDLVATSRGELGIFVFRVFMMTVLTYLLMWMLAKALSSFGLAPQLSNAQGEPHALPAHGAR